MNGCLSVELWCDVPDVLALFGEPVCPSVEVFKRDS